MGAPDRPTLNRIAALGCWQGAIDVVPLTGGLSNEIFTVTDGRGRFVVRFGRDFPFHHVFRDREQMVARAADRAGFAPDMIHTGHGFMVCRFIEGRTFGAADVQANIGRIADLVRRFHREMPAEVSGPGFLFWVFHVIRDYARTLEAGESRMAGEIPGYLALAEKLEAVQVPLPVVFGHNDLLPANFLDDGERLWLIDFEYAGFNTGLFDLAGIATNAEFDRAQSASLLEHYFGAAPSSELARAYAAMKCASLLRESMWSMVSEIHLDAPGADYRAYTAENLARLERALAAYREEWGEP